MKKIRGVATNDADYPVCPKVNGKTQWCPFYRRWKNMIERCYSQTYQETKPTYEKCYVTKDWLLFSTFKTWMEAQDWSGRALDKDLLVAGNKEYGPRTCVFIHNNINTLLTYDKRSSANLMPGVTKLGAKFRATIGTNTKTAHLGVFISEGSAHRAWRDAKAKIIEAARELTDDIRVKEALTKRSWGLLCL
tara:strand:+ start:2873 stop:3445 length:573 start_codon:yes stop_codon:yes gene_type:complete